MHRDGLALRLRTRSDTVRFVYLHTILCLCHIYYYEPVHLKLEDSVYLPIFFITCVFIYLSLKLRIVYNLKLVLFCFII